MYIYIYIYICMYVGIYIYFKLPCNSGEKIAKS